ncbi:MAG: hypothetical protein IAE79_11290 [Anaerolinea sp.]|nr:hypothetical protein [Anaerolinea sp.]
MKYTFRLMQLVVSLVLPVLFLSGMYRYAVGQQAPPEPEVVVLPGGNCPTGQSPKVGEGLDAPWPQYLYTGMYGWFDRSHFQTGEPAQVISDVQAAITAGGGVITISQGVRDNLTGYTARYWIAGSVAEPDALRVALGVYLDWSRRFESWQGEPPRSIAGPLTSFAIEDLPSQYVGFFAAARGLSYAQVFGCYLGGMETAVADPPHFDFAANSAESHDLLKMTRLRNDTFTPLVQTEEGWQHRPWPEGMQLTAVGSKPGTWYFLGETTWYFEETS